MIIKIKNCDNMAELVRILVVEGYGVNVVKRPNEIFKTGIPTYEISISEMENKDE